MIDAATTAPLSVSIIVCTYEREEPLRQLLRDLLLQDVAPLEIIIVDQTRNHEPETLNLLASTHDIRVMAVNEPNLPAARNIGLSYSGGDIVVFVDDDLRLDRTLIRTVLEEFADPLVEGWAPRVVDTRDAAQRADNESIGIGALKPHRRRVGSVIGACMAFRRAAVLQVGGFDPLLGRMDRTATGEDLEFTRRFTRGGFRLYISGHYSIVHELQHSGGCRNREGVPLERHRSQQLAVSYILLKEHGSLERLNLRGAAAVVSSHVIRRDVMISPRRVVRAICDALSAIGAVRLSWRCRAPDSGSASVSIS